MQVPFKKKTWTLGYQYCSFVNFCKINVCPKTWAYFTLKLGWLKTNVETNIGPQNNMYLSAPGFSITGFSNLFTNESTDRKFVYHPSNSEANWFRMIVILII